ncbi:unnamed protein product [Clavelina lepadiformis]|uniref:C2H2-type domain-containing protein n=1 Tax=Clavelina lepadiformis TaxID=159417 RepID=A0ABP0EZJ5_CLALP
MSLNKVYSFFTEISVEDKSEQVYTRIGQVCKHDGGWRNLRNQFSSFFKARLNCSLPGQPPFYFNELSDVTELVTLDKLYKVGKTKIVFALMNTPSNSIPASAICAFSLPDIEASMNGAFYEKFADAKTSAQYWAQQDNYSESHLACCASYPSKLSVRSINFMRMHPIMYQSVNAWDLHNNVTQPHNAIPLYSRTNSGSLKKAILSGKDLLRESKEESGEPSEPSESGGGPIKKRRPRPKKKCPICGVMNSNITRHCQDVHRQTYKGEGEFQCEICLTRLTSRLGLVRHLRGNRHAGEPKAKAMVRSLDRRRKTLPMQESPCFNWEDILSDFRAFLMGHDGEAHEESIAMDRVQLIRHIIKDFEFHDFHSFSIETYKEKHVQNLEKEKKTPATFISHSNAMTSFLNFAIMRKLPLSFNVGEALLNLINRRASYRKFLKKRRQVIKERDRRNALDPEEVARVMKNRIFHKTALATKLWENDPGAEVRRAHGEILMAFLVIENSQRTSAVRNMLVEELKHGYQTKKRRWIVRVRDHKTSAKYEDATIVMPGWLKEGLDKFVQFNGGACEIVFPHQGNTLTSSAAAKAIQWVWKLTGGRGKFTATSNRKHSATQVRSKKPDSRFLVAKHMAHSSATQESYYANELQNAEAEKAYELINEIRIDISGVAGVSKLPGIRQWAPLPNLVQLRRKLICNFHRECKHGLVKPKPQRVALDCRPRNNILSDIPPSLWEP